MLAGSIETGYSALLGQDTVVTRPLADRRRLLLAREPPDVEMKRVRDGLIEQLDRCAAQHLSHNGLEFETWLGRTVMDQEQWLARIVLPTL